MPVRRVREKTLEETMNAAKPSLIIKFDVDNSLESKETTAELKRTYTYVATTKVNYHDATQPAANVIGLNVIAHEPYWYADGDEYWEQVMLPWLTRIINKLEKTLPAHYRARASEGTEPMVFDEAVVVFGDNAQVHLPLDGDGKFPGSALELLSAARAEH